LKTEKSQTETLAVFSFFPPFCQMELPIRSLPAWKEATLTNLALQAEILPIALLRIAWAMETSFYNSFIKMEFKMEMIVAWSSAAIIWLLWKLFEKAIDRYLGKWQDRLENWFRRKTLWDWFQSKKPSTEHDKAKRRMSHRTSRRRRQTRGMPR
jgi:hypothetical protein